jgi:hypothetical protein
MPSFTPRNRQSVVRRGLLSGGQGVIESGGWWNRNANVVGEMVPGERVRDLNSDAGKLRFAADSLLEGTGFEPSVPHGEVPDASCVRCPLCWHPLPLQKPKERTLVGPAEALPTGRHHPGMAGDIILERRARSNRNAERDHHGFASDFPRNPQACPSGARCSAGSAGKRWRGTFRRRAMMRRS